MNVARSRRGRPAWNSSTQPTVRAETGLLSDAQSYLLVANAQNKAPTITSKRRRGKWDRSQNERDRTHSIHRLVVKNWHTLVGTCGRGVEYSEVSTRPPKIRASKAHLGENETIHGSNDWQNPSSNAREDQHELSKQIWALFTGRLWHSSVRFLSFYSCLLPVPVASQRKTINVLRLGKKASRAGQCVGGISRL